MGRPATVITLSETEKSELLRRIKLRKGAQDARLRAETILGCAAGESGNDIAQRLGTSKDVVSRWRQRFSKLGLLGLNVKTLVRGGPPGGYLRFRRAHVKAPCAGEVAEWLKAHAWNACIGETLSRVRIPLSPAQLPNKISTSRQARVV